MSYRSARTDAQPADVFVQPDGDVKVWRYLTLPKLLYALDRRVLVLPRVDILNDLHEGAMPAQNKQAFRQFLLDSGVPIEAVEQATARLINHADQWRNGLFVSCWHVNSVESEAMWQLYCGRDEGVALQTTYAKLDASLPPVSGPDGNVFIGKIRYSDGIQPGGNAFHRVMHKRRAFAHEHEARVLITKPKFLFGKEARPDASPRVLEVSWDAAAITELLCVNPYAQEWYLEAVRAAIRRFAPTLEDRLQWSQIRSNPWV
jgi:hypothetical protein